MWDFLHEPGQGMPPCAAAYVATADSQRFATWLYSNGFVMIHPWFSQDIMFPRRRVLDPVLSWGASPFYSRIYASRNLHNPSCRVHGPWLRFVHRHRHRHSPYMYSTERSATGTWMRQIAVVCIRHEIELTCERPHAGHYCGMQSHWAGRSLSPSSIVTGEGLVATLARRDCKIAWFTNPFKSPRLPCLITVSAAEISDL